MIHFDYPPPPDTPPLPLEETKRGCLLCLVTVLGMMLPVGLVGCYKLASIERSVTAIEGGEPADLPAEEQP